MKKKPTFLDELNEYREKTPKKYNGPFAVLKNKDNIKGAVKEGFSLTEIYTVLQSKGQMPICYSSFCKHYLKYIKQDNTQEHNTPKINEEKTEKKKGAFNPENHPIETIY